MTFEPVYSEYRANDKDFVIAEANDYNIEFQFSKGCHISAYSEEIFEKLIVYLQEQGTEVDLYLCPLSPALWDRIEQEKESYIILKELEMFAHEMSNKYELKLTGAYNPYQIGATNSDFWDSRHFRHDRLDDFFSFVSKEEEM